MYTIDIYISLSLNIHKHTHAHLYSHVCSANRFIKKNQRDNLKNIIKVIYYSGAKMVAETYRQTN